MVPLVVKCTYKVIKRDDVISSSDVASHTSRGTKVAYRAKTHILCTRKVYGWNLVYA